MEYIKVISNTYNAYEGEYYTVSGEDENSFIVCDKEGIPKNIDKNKCEIITKDIKVIKESEERYKEHIEYKEYFIKKQLQTISDEIFNYYIGEISINYKLFDEVINILKVKGYKVEDYSKEGNYKYLIRWA